MCTTFPFPISYLMLSILFIITLSLCTHFSWDLRVFLIVPVNILKNLSSIDPWDTCTFSLQALVILLAQWSIKSKSWSLMAFEQPAVLFSYLLSSKGLTFKLGKICKHHLDPTPFKFSIIFENWGWQTIDFSSSRKSPMCLSPTE